jgi:hypothetical protein
MTKLMKAGVFLERTATRKKFDRVVVRTMENEICIFYRSSNLLQN